MKRYLLYFVMVTFTVVLLGGTPGKCAVYEADHIPWSGWWWPFKHGGLVTGYGYNGHPAPLEKFDYAVNNTFYGPATAYGVAHYYDTSALSWEGMCFCWAGAAVLEPEPVQKGIYKGVRFGVGDKKALLTVAYDIPMYYAYVLDDPVEFHRVLSEYIAVQAVPVIMDLGTGDEIWNFPVYKYDTSYTQLGNTRHYETTISYVSDQVSPDYVGSAVVTGTYFYYFELDGNQIIDSGWESGSAAVHPRKAFEVYGTRGWNTGLDFEEVQKIVGTNGDGYENNHSFDTAHALSPGRYPLILSRHLSPESGWTTETDYFKVSMLPGNEVYLRVNTLDKGQGIILRVYDPEHALIGETDILGEESGELEITVTRAGVHVIEVAPMASDGGEPGYELFLQEQLAHQGVLLLDPSGTWANGVAVLTPEGCAEKTVISQMTRSGAIEKSYSLPEGTCHFVGHASQLGLEAAGKGYLRVDSDTPISALQAVASGRSLLLGSNLISRESASATLFLPHVQTDSGWSTYWGVINIGNQPETLELESYTAAGEVRFSDTILLAPGQKVEYDAAYTPVLDGATTMKLATRSGRESLIGYEQLYNPSGTAGRCLVSLSGGGEPLLVVPHVASNEYWTTDIIVMNSGDFFSDIRFSGYDSKGVLVDSVVHRLAARQRCAMETSALFPSAASGQIVSVQVVSLDEQPLCGMSLYASRNGRQLGGMALRSEGRAMLYLPHIASSDMWWTGIGVLNPNDSGIDLAFSLFDERQERLGLINRYLHAHQRLAVNMRGLFGETAAGNARYLKIESSDGRPVSGIYLFGSNNGFLLMGDVIGQ